MAQDWRAIYRQMNHASWRADEYAERFRSERKREDRAAMRHAARGHCMMRLETYALIDLLRLCPGDPSAPPGASQRREEP